MYHNVSKEKLKKIMNSKKQKKKVDKGSIKDIKMNEDGFLEVEKKKRPKHNINSLLLMNHFPEK